MSRKHSIRVSGKPLRMSERRFTALNDEMVGLCRSCGAERDTCEPDARDYPCAACGAIDVYGVEELLLRGEIEFT